MTQCWPAWTLIETPETPPDGHQACKEDCRDCQERCGQKDYCRCPGCEESGTTAEGGPDRSGEEGRRAETGCSEEGAGKEGPGQDRRSCARREHRTQVAA